MFYCNGYPGCDGCSECVDTSVPCEECGERLFTGEPRIKMDGLVYCSGPCALEEVAS